MCTWDQVERMMDQSGYDGLMYVTVGNGVKAVVYCNDGLFLTKYMVRGCDECAWKLGLI